MLLPHFDFPQGLCVGPTYLFGLGRLVLVLRQTETIRLQKFSSLILKVRRRLKHPVLFIVMTATGSDDAPDHQADHDRLLHQPTFMRYKKRTWKRMPLKSSISYV
jgi:hypothetical protein